MNKKNETTQNDRGMSEDRRNHYCMWCGKLLKVTDFKDRCYPDCTKNIIHLTPDPLKQIT
jgi:hypothetical protein